MRLILDLLINAVAIIVAAYILPGVVVTGIEPALIAAIVLAIINAFIKPIIILVTLPLTILTLGLFILVINTIVILVTSAIVPGFDVAGFFWAFLFSVVLWIVNAVLHSIEERVVST